MRDAVLATEVGPEVGEVLQRLRESPGEFVSGTNLSKELAISRTGVWNAVRYLTSLGYEVEARTKRGYRLTTPRWRLSPAEIMGSVPERFAHNVHYYTVVSSTVEVARRQAKAGAPDGTLVLAEYQAKGRGRTGRKWYAPLGSSILATIIHEPAKGTDLSLLPMVVARAGATAAGCRLTWPNDLCVEGRKVGGAMVGLHSLGDRHLALLSLGLNVLGDPEAYPPGLANRLTTLEAEGLAEPTANARLPFLAAWLEALASGLDGLAAGESPAPEWAGLLDGEGSEAVWLDLAGRRHEGTFLGGTPTGGARVRANGQETLLDAAKVAIFRLGPPV